MARLDPVELTTRREKVVSATIVLVSVLVHLGVLLGGLIRLAPERPEAERRLMTVRRVPQTTPPPPAPAERQVFQRKEAAVPAEGKAPREGTRKSRDETREREEEPQPAAPEEVVPEDTERRKQNTVTVMTDLAEAFFRLEGPRNQKGAGVYWEKTGLPSGEYRVVFGAVEGFDTPPPQTGTLAEGGSLSFVGRYTKMTLVTVAVNIGQARFKIVRPDGQYLDLKGKSQGLFRDLPPGTYTIIFEEVPGYGAPGPQSRKLGPGGSLGFSGAYAPLGGEGVPAGTGPSRPEKKRPTREPVGPAFDSRVRMLVTTYFRSDPDTGVEREYGTMAYPERIIRRENYQEGWCQVYLVLQTDDAGEITRVNVERPGEADRAAFAPLVDAVEKAVRGWQFERQAAEVHVDIRFFVER